MYVVRKCQDLLALNDDGSFRLDVAACEVNLLEERKEGSKE